jgi:tryptophan 2,3-dioxygenase
LQGKYAPPHLLATESHEDFSEPILPGAAASDYERYLRTDDLLSLQKTPEEQSHPDELLFQTVHQSSELWLKLGTSEVARATAHLRAGEVAPALRLLRRASLCLQFIVRQLDMLEQMSPWEYQTIRRVLGHGSGFDSPGFREVRRVTPPLGEAFENLVADAGLDVVEVYVQGRDHDDLYQLAEALIEWDERITMWRIRHYKVVARIIGDQVVGTQGTPVEVLGKMIHHNFFPALWRARNQLTERAKEEESDEAEVPGHGR